MISREDWDRAAPHLQAAITRGGNLYTLADVAERIALGEVQLMLTANSAAALEYRDFPRAGRRALSVWLAGGDLGEIVGPGLDDVLEIAKRENCTDLLVSGRGGWTRALEPHGFKPMWQVLRKALA